MVVVAVSEDDTDDLFTGVFKIGKIGDENVDAEVRGRRKADAAVDDQLITAVLVKIEVFGDGSVAA